MLSPLPQQNATVSFYFGSDQKNTHGKSKPSTGIKHSPIVPFARKMTTEAKTTNTKKCTQRSCKKEEEITKQPINHTTPSEDMTNQENILDHRRKSSVKRSENSTKQKAKKTSKQAKSSSKHAKSKSKSIKSSSQHSSSTHLPPSKRPRATWCSVEDQRMIRVLESILGEDFENSEMKVNWADVAIAMNTGRNAKQCRDRWMNYLRPGLKKGEWDQKEEKLINEMYTNFGPKWCAMAKLLPNRAENDIKNKWYSMMRKQKRSRGKLEADINAWTDCATGNIDVERKVEDEDWEPDLSEDVFKPKPGGKDLSRLIASQAANIHHV